MSMKNMPVSRDFPPRQPSRQRQRRPGAVPVGRGFHPRVSSHETVSGLEFPGLRPAANPAVDALAVSPATKRLGWLWLPKSSRDAPTWSAPRRWSAPCSPAAVGPADHCGIGQRDDDMVHEDRRPAPKSPPPRPQAVWTGRRAAGRIVKPTRSAASSADLGSCDRDRGHLLRADDVPVIARLDLGNGPFRSPRRSASGCGHRYRKRWMF